MTMRTESDVIVIGGGIIGLACAYYLSERHLSVALLERGEIGGGASGACDDMILLQSKKPGINLQLAFESLELYKSLSDRFDSALELHAMGGMIFIETPEQLEIMTKFVESQREYGLPVEILDVKDVRRKQPHVTSSVVASTFCPIDSQVSPFKVCYTFLRAARERGAAIRAGDPVSGITQNGDFDWIVSTQSGTSYRAPYVVNAAGAWASQLAAMIGVELPIVPKRGQIVVTEKLPPVGETNVWSAQYIASKLQPSGTDAGSASDPLGLGFSFSRTGHGTYLIGSTRESVGYDTGTTYEAISRIVGQAVRYFPIFRHIHLIRSFSGLRPATADGKPIIGEAPGKKGFITAAGHEGDGIALAPVTGKIVADLIAGTTSTLPVAELAPDRFAVPAVG